MNPSRGQMVMISYLQVPFGEVDEIFWTVRKRLCLGDACTLTMFKFSRLYEQLLLGTWTGQSS
jgi:hypothetical protein